MFGIEKAYCNTMIAALLEGNRSLLETPITDAVRKSHVPYKGDTLGLDQRPENSIAAELTRFDQYAVLVTEERGEYANPLARSEQHRRGPRTFFVCDPTDRSVQLKKFLETASQKQTVGEVLHAPDVVQRWEAAFGNPAKITGANAAITCVRRGLPICSVVLNYVTQEIAVACSAGIYSCAVPQGRDLAPGFTLDALIREERRICFTESSPEHERRFVTFLGKPERGYPENFEQTRLVPKEELQTHLHYGDPGGPSRILYLSDFQPPEKPIGFIVANGEKIGEWVHWFPFIRFARRTNDVSERALRIFEITQEQSLMRDGYLMTPSTA